MNLNPSEQAYLARAMGQLGIPQVDVQVNPKSKGDIWIELGNPMPRITCGQKWIRSNPKLRKTKLTHELLHAAGMRHGAKARAAGYYSRPEKDRYSPEVHRQLENPWPDDAEGHRTAARKGWETRRKWSGHSILTHYKGEQPIRYYTSLKVAERAAQGLVKKYPFYEVRIVRRKTLSPTWEVLYGKKAANPVLPFGPQIKEQKYIPPLPATRIIALRKTAGHDERATWYKIPEGEIGIPTFAQMEGPYKVYVATFHQAEIKTALRFIREGTPITLSVPAEDFTIYEVKR